MRTRRAAAVAVMLGLATVAATAGCSVHPGAAAVVDGHEISETYLHDTYEDFADLGSATPAQLLGILVAMRATDDVAVEQGISVTGTDAISALEDQGVDTSGFSPGGVEIARYLAIAAKAQTLGADEYQAVSEQLDAARKGADIVINPRYGSLDEATGSMVEPAPAAWIVTPAAAPAAG